MAGKPRGGCTSGGVAGVHDDQRMLNHLRVSIGSDEEMGRFMNAFEDVMRQTATSNSGG